jgi:hypothetical protein
MSQPRYSKQVGGGKQYKNVYTILEKVKKGEIDTYYKRDSGGLFSKIDFYKKPDLIKPHMHWLDERRIESIMDSYIRDGKSVKEVYEKFAKSADFNKKISDDKKPDLQKFYNKVKENYDKFPKHILKDIFKMYNNPVEKLEFEERTDKNNTKFKFLENANNPVAKIMSQGSNLKSAIFARNIMAHYLMRMTMMDYIDPDQSQKIKNGLNGQSDFDDAGDGVDDMCNSSAAKKAMEDAIKDATDLCKKMDDSMDGETQEMMFDNADKTGDENTAGKLSPDYIKQVTAKLESIRLSMGSLKDKLKKLLDKSVSYFSSREEVEYEDLFNSDNIAGLEEYELLHPKLRKIFAEDVYVKNTKKVGKLDVYIDVSGSMSSDCGVKNTRGEYISRIDFCKSMVAKLSEMDMLNDVYLFDNRVKKYRKDPISIAMLTCSGGTTINAAVRSIVNNENNAIILTDAEDGCDIYSEKAFFIGLRGARFNHFKDDVIAQYSNRDQVIIFDGTTVKKVNDKGL